MAKLSVLVVTAEQEVFRGEALMVIAASKAGELAIMPGHAPLLADLRPGALRIQCPNAKKDQTDELCVDIVIHGGYLEVQPNAVTVLADAVERAEEIDMAQAERAVGRAKEKLASARDKDINLAMLRLELELARLHVVCRGKGIAPRISR